MRVISYIRSFHSSVLHWLMKHSSNAKQLYSPSCMLNPKDVRSVGRRLLRCADCKAEVDTMRVNMTFLWMSDLLPIHWAWSIQCTDITSFLATFKTLYTVHLSVYYVPFVIKIDSKSFYQNRCISTLSIHGHRTLKAPHPVRSAQLTRVPPS